MWPPKIPSGRLSHMSRTFPEPTVLRRCLHDHVCFDEHEEFVFHADDWCITSAAVAIDMVRLFVFPAHRPGLAWYWVWVPVDWFDPNSSIVSNGSRVH